MGRLGVLLGSFGAVLEPSWPVLNCPGVVLGSSWDAPGLFWCGLEPSWFVLKCHGVVLGSSWGPPGLFWGGLGALVACLRLSWRRQGPSWTRRLEPPRAFFAA